MTGPIRDLVICLQFYSRLPLRFAVGPAPWTMADFARATRLAPLAGLLIGLAPAGALAAASALGLPALVGATLAAAVAVLVTGGLHEDGLADVADGFGGGVAPARKLEIMRDSRIGSFGTLALILSLAFRIGALAALLGRDGVATATVVVATAAGVSRGFGLVPLGLLPPARPDGLAAGAGLLPRASLASALLLAAVTGLLPSLAGVAIWRTILAGALALAAAFGMTRLAKRQIGGATGDVAGAAQQLCEICYTVGLLIAPGAP